MLVIVFSQNCLVYVQGLIQVLRLGGAVDGADVEHRRRKDRGAIKAEEGGAFMEMTGCLHRTGG